MGELLRQSVRTNGDLDDGFGAAARERPGRPLDRRIVLASLAGLGTTVVSGTARSTDGSRPEPLAAVVPVQDGTPPRATVPASCGECRPGLAADVRRR